MSEKNVRHSLYFILKSLTVLCNHYAAGDVDEIPRESIQVSLDTAIDILENGLDETHERKFNESQN